MQVALEPGSGLSWKTFEEHDRKSPDCLEQGVGIWSLKPAGEGSERNEEHVHGNWKHLQQYQKA